MAQYGLLGRKLGHSYSALIHEHMAGYGYKLHPVEPEGLEAAVKDPAMRGWNVTIPYKQDVIPFLDALTPQAEAIGAVNTVYRQNGLLMGDNSDFFGMSRMLEGLPIHGRKALVLGSGGTSLTARHVLKNLGAGEVVVVSRGGDVHYGNVYDLHSDAGFLLNATPVGMYPGNDGCPIEPERFEKLEAVADVIYNPLKTRLICRAERMGLPTAGGLSMLVWQAWKSAERFLGEALPESAAAETLAWLERKTQNLVLVGMPGCGKSSVACALGKALAREVIDMDEEIARRCGMSVPEYIQTQGIEAFRDRESEVAEWAGMQTGKVIATGGGAVLRVQNRDALKQNGFVAYIQRDVEALPMNGRPLSSGREALREMFAVRDPIYREICDVNIKNDAAQEDCVRRVREAFEGA